MNHTCYIDQNFTDIQKRGACSCGWRGAWHDDVQSAAAEWGIHVGARS